MSESFVIIAYGKDMRDAYDNARKMATKYYGEDPYNGTISTTYGCSKVYCNIDANTNWTKTKEKKAYEIAYKLLDSMDKHECKGIDIGKVSNRVTHHNGWHAYLLFGWAAC